MARSEAEAGALIGAAFPAAVPLADARAANDHLARMLPRDAVTAWSLSLAEGLAVVAASIACGVLYSWFANGYLGDVGAFAGIGLVVAALFASVRRHIDAGRGTALEGDGTSLRRAALAWCAVFGGLAGVVFLLKIGAEVSRGAILSFFAVGFLAAEAARARMAVALARWYLPRSLRGEHSLIIGAAGEPERDWLRGELVRAGSTNLSDFTFDAHCADAAWPAERDRVIQRAMDCARVTGHGQICVSGAGLAPERLRQLLIGLQAIPRAVRLVPGAAIERLLHLPQHALGSVRAIEIQRTPLNRLQRVVKRAIDLALGVPALVVALPLLAAIALAVRLDSPGPVLFRQQRLGFRGRPFTILKFRTMTVQENCATVTQATRCDARVTRIGRILRAWSLDELPQLFNVLKGEMSLVGPRPHACVHDARYARLIGHYELRQHVKPGITGWAQVNGRRGETPTVESMRDRVDFDVWYAKNAGIALDIEILFRTAFEVFRRRNAY
jgi:Undecaprenyl-phosphate glucose phosphotransferase